MEYTVEHTVGYQRLLGSVENQHLSELKVRPTEDGLSVVGRIGPKEVRLWFTQKQIEGYLGRCPVSMSLDPRDEAEDKVVHHVNAQGQRMRVELYGMHALRKMPVADQAAVMPMMLLCVQEQVFANLHRGETPPLGFGGPLGAVPNGSLHLEGDTGSYRDCGAREYR